MMCDLKESIEIDRLDLEMHFAVCAAEWNLVREGKMPAENKVDCGIKACPYCNGDDKSVINDENKPIAEWSRQQLECGYIGLKHEVDWLEECYKSLLKKFNALEVRILNLEGKNA